MGVFDDIRCHVEWYSGTILGTFAAFARKAWVVHQEEGGAIPVWLSFEWQQFTLIHLAMSSHSLRSSNSSENESSNVSFKVDDYLTLHEELQEGYPPSTPSRQQNPFLPKLDIDRARKSGIGVCDKSKSAAKNSPIGCGFRIAFRTKSQIEILDDGYKWRKYGKKMMKNSMNPRNYYRCSSMGCDVKKRVERARDDPNYVITTYEGVHNHQEPSSKEACFGPPDPPPCFYHFSS